MLARTRTRFEEPPLLVIVCGDLLRCLGGGCPLVGVVAGVGGVGGVGVAPTPATPPLLATPALLNTQIIKYT